MQRSAWIAVAVTLLFGLLAGARLWSAPTSDTVLNGDAPSKAAPAKDAHAHESGGKKSMFSFDNFLDLTIWTWVVFLLLCLVLSRYAWKPILEGLQKREQNIARAQEEAEKAQRETRQLQSVLQAKLDAASQEIAGRMEEARRDAQALAEELRAEARKDIQADRERLHRELQVAKDQALQELWTQTAQLATLISTKALRRNMTEEDHRRLIDEALQEFHESGTEQYRKMANVRKS